MPGLFDPITVRTTEFRNRLWVSPMCQYSCLDRDGVPTDWHLVHLGSFARGGAGLVMAEATAVAPEGRIAPEDTGLWSDAQEAAWARITAFARSQGAVPGVQLAHAGRKASTFSPWGDARHGSVPVDEGGWPTVAPSAIAFDGYATPRALEAHEIPGLVAAFADAARRAVRAGFGVVEIHAAHGYLLHEFLSPLSNLRDDAYGGSLENRARLLLEIVRAVRDAVGSDLPVFMRFSATDWADGGWDAEQTATVAAWAQDAGADLFDISSGGLVAHQAITLGPGYQVPFAEQIGDDADVPVSAVGLITDPAQADDIIRSGRADAVMLGRELLRDPHFPLRAAHALGIELDYWPPQYLRARWS
ncbi:MAG: oxidoreductase [Leifsonia xyli]|nr:MAG: oxidoreductase [Leifsonia xyli]